MVVCPPCKVRIFRLGCDGKMGNVTDTGKRLTTEAIRLNGR